MRMPEMDGATFLKHVRQRWPQVMRILLTGYADITSTVAAINEGEIYRYISKPWDDNEIVLVVSEALARRRLEQENRRLSELTQRQNEELKELNTGLEQKVTERTAEVRAALNELKKTFLATVQVFAGMVELRSGQVCKQLTGTGGGLDEHARVRLIAWAERTEVHRDLAGLIHDVGKIACPRAARQAVQTLASQRALVRSIRCRPETHESVEKRATAPCCRHHHELYDGSGLRSSVRQAIRWHRILT